MFFFLLGTETHIADLVLTSELTTSNWGDRRLLFRHQNMADDVMLKPEWDPYLEKVSPSIQTCPGREPKNRRERERVFALECNTRTLSGYIFLLNIVTKIVFSIL